MTSQAPYVVDMPSGHLRRGAEKPSALTIALAAKAAETEGVVAMGADGAAILYRARCVPQARHRCRDGRVRRRMDAADVTHPFSDIIFESTIDTSGHTLDLRPAVISRVHKHHPDDATSALFCCGPPCVFTDGSCVTSRGRVRFACRDGLRIHKARGSSLLE